MRRSFAYAFGPGRNEYLVRLVFLAGEERSPAALAVALLAPALAARQRT
jgi:hypothetical protein